MRLLSCHIENFGNIKQREYDFYEGITACCENNGYGKTTLASFLKAMFYGMKTTTARDKEVGERERFYPFDGGKYGGNVTFEFDGDVYRIERYFGKKSASEDTVALFRGGERLSENVDAGKEFFGLDEQSFLKTVFINSSDTEVSATGDISKMLNEFVDDADYEKAIKALEKLKKDYKAARGSNDKISRQTSYIAELKDSIENKRKISDGLSAKYEKLNALKAEVDFLRARQNALVESNLERQKWNTYDNYRADADEEHKKLSLLRLRYPAGLPDGDEAKELSDCADGITRARERLAATQLTDEKGKRLEELENRFVNGVPTQEKIDGINALISDKITLDAGISAVEHTLSSVDGSRFPAGIPDGAEIERYSEKLSALRQLKDSKNVPAEPKSHKKLLLIPAILALVLIGCGIGMFFVKALIGGILLAAGAVTALVGVFFYFKMQINLVKAVNDGKADAKTGELENEIRAFLSRLGYYTLNGVEVDFNNLLRDVELYRQNVAAREENIALLNSKREERAAVLNRIKEFFSAYGFSGENGQACLAELNWLIAEYLSLSGEKNSAAERAAACNSEIKTCTSKVIDILSKYDIAPQENLAEQSRLIEADGRELSRLTESYKELDRRAVKYRADNNLKNRPTGENEEEDVEERLDKKNEELIRLNREIDDDESQIETLASLQGEEEIAEEKLKELQSRYELITKTAALLERAETNLKDRYVSPIKESFLNYSQALEKALGEKVSMDKEFKVYFERSGENRSDAHLSAGQKSLCALCVRLALIDNMYKGERPFIIMDDPFVHLDAEHMQRARALLSLLAKDRQIIYFCCHSSREL